METVLEVRQLTKRYRNGCGISNVSFDVRRGGVFGLFRPNGSGKTGMPCGPAAPFPRASCCRRSYSCCPDV
jgi:ABC-type phosphonate transport system ATPase subunit